MAEDEVKNSEEKDAVNGAENDVRNDVVNGDANDAETDVKDDVAKTEKEEKKSGGEGNGGKRLKKVKWVIIILILWLVLACVLRLVIHLASFSHTHLTDEGLTHAIRFQNSVVVHGIDVSEFQDDINWKRVKSSEADFVFIRAGYRRAETGELVEDEDFKSNIKKANRAGIMTGAYFFSQAVNEAEAIEEADYLLDLVEPYDISMPLVIDFELYDGGRLQQAIDAGDLPAASLYHDIVLAFCRRVEEAGYESAVYANYDMLTNYMDSSILDNDATIWAAQYDGACYVKGNYLYWQCAEDAAIDGIEGPVDHDIWYIEPGKVYATKAAGKKEQVSIGECEILLNAKSYKLKDNRAKPKVVVMYGDKKLHPGKDYIMSYVRNTTSGTGYVIVQGIGKYKDWTSKAFTIE